MALTSSDARYAARALKDFFGITARPINVTEDAAEGADKPEREYILRAVVVEEVDGADVKRAVMLESLADAIALVTE